MEVTDQGRFYDIDRLLTRPSQFASPDFEPDAGVILAI
jgi:hypothetical protein